jgi:hypothetical protein
VSFSFLLVGFGCLEKKEKSKRCANRCPGSSGSSGSNEGVALPTEGVASSEPSGSAVTVGGAGILKPGVGTAMSTAAALLFGVMLRL